MKARHIANAVVGANAKVARNNRGWSQRDLVRALDDRVNQSTISRLENGLLPVNVEAIVAISGALQVPPASLMRGVR